MTHPIVIVGAGQAGLQVADSLRQEGFEGRIVLAGDEPHAPYNRPPLSKKWLLEHPDAGTLLLRSPDYLRRKSIELQSSCRVVAIDCAARTVDFDNGDRIHWSGLALCTGARARALPLPGADLAGVHALRSLDDAMKLSAAFDACEFEQKPLVVIGGGFIGLEAAATARKRGIAVTVLEGLDRLMSRALAPMVSEAMRAVHEAHGVRLVFDARVAALEGEMGTVNAVRLADGTRIDAGCVLVGIGVEQNDGLAVAAGIECDRGIIVDACSRTSAAHVVAAGDCTAHRRGDGGVLRLESVHNAVEQGKAGAAALLGREKPFTATPWFWSDQYDVRLQMVGLSRGYDQAVTRGDVQARTFSAYYYRAGRLIAVDSLSRPQEHMMARKLLDHGISPAPEQAADPSFPLQSLLPERRP